MRARLPALLLSACLLAGCSSRPAQSATAMPGVGGGTVSQMPAVYGLDPWSDFFGLWPEAPAQGDGDAQGDVPGWLLRPDQIAPAHTEAQRAYGSAGLVGWPSVLVSLYLDERDGEGWDEQEIARTRQTLAVAVDWIAAQCEAYHASPTIHYDDGTADSGLFLRATYEGRFAGGQESDEGDAFYDAVDDLCAQVDTEALAQRYGTDSIGFLVFLPVAGNAFSIVHYFEDGDDYYPEYCCLYQYDAWEAPGTWDEPAVYAHEILHLFGAPDLYEGSRDAYVTPELAAYVEQNWPDALMRDTYSADGAHFDRIAKTLCPLTAYRLGLCATWPGLADFPASAAAPPGTFTEENAPATFENGAVAL